VLLVGNTTGNNDIVISNGYGIEGESSFDINAQSGSEGTISIIGGSSSGANTGGGINITSGSSVSGTSGSIAIAADSSGISGGAVSISSGSGSTSGGNLTLQAGAGTTVAGDVTISGGTGNSGGEAGSVVLTGGSSSEGNAGNIDITAGDGYDAGGNINLTSGSTDGDGGYTGAINISGGTATDGALTNSINISGCIAGTGANSNGGNVNVTGGQATNAGTTGGIANVSGGSGLTGGEAKLIGGSGSSVGGNVIIECGSSPSTPGQIRFNNGSGSNILFITSAGIVTTETAGEITIRPDSNLYLQTAESSSGAIYIQSDTSVTVQGDNGGDANVYGGNGTSTGGAARLIGGNSTAGDNNGGSVRIVSGSGSGTGSDGNIDIEVGSSGSDYVMRFDEGSASSFADAEDGYVVTINASGFVRYTSISTNTPTLAEVLVEGNSAANVRITNILDPVDDQDAATKAWVEQQLSSVSGGGGTTKFAHERPPVTQLDQTEFELSTTPSDGYDGYTTVMMFLNQLKVELTDYSVSGTTVTYSGSETINPGTHDVEFYYPTTSGTAPKFVPILSGVSTNDGYGWTVIGATEIDTDEYDFSTATFECILSSTDGYDDGYFIAQARLFNVTTALAVSSILEVDGPASTLVSEVVSLSAGSNIYEVQLRLSEDGGGSEFATCSMARIRLE
jgi:hypothetical protein